MTSRLAAANALLNWLIRQECTERNPLAGLSRVNQRGKKAFESRALTVDELGRVVAASSDRGWTYLIAA